MPMQALEVFEKRIKLFEQMIGKNIEKRVRLFEEGFERKDRATVAPHRAENRPEH